MRAPDDHIVEAVIAELRPLKQRRNLDDLRKEIEGSFTVVRMTKDARLPSAAALTKKAKAAAKMVKIADKENLPVADEVRRLAVINPPPGRKINGPDSRFDYAASVAAFRARCLIEDLSKKKPAKTEDGNVHRVSRLFYQSVFPGRILEKTELLGAVRWACAYKR